MAYQYGYDGTYQQPWPNSRYGGGVETADDIYERFHNNMASYNAGNNDAAGQQETQQRQQGEDVGGNCIFRWLRNILLVEAALFWGLFGYQYLVCSQRHECHMLMNTMKSFHEMPKATFYLTASSIFGGTAIAFAAVTERILYLFAGFVDRMFYGKLCSLSPKHAAASSSTMMGQSHQQGDQKTYPDSGTSAGSYATWYNNNMGPCDSAEAQEPQQEAVQSLSKAFSSQSRQQQEADDAAGSKSNASFYSMLKNKCYDLLGNTPERDQTPFQQATNNGLSAGLKNDPLNNYGFGSNSYAGNPNNNGVGYYSNMHVGHPCPVHGSRESTAGIVNQQESKSSFRTYIDGVKAFLGQPFDFPESPDELRARRVAKKQQAAVMYDHHQDRSSRYFTPPILSRSPSVSSSSSDGTSTSATYNSMR